MVFLMLVLWICCGSWSLVFEVVGFVLEIVVAGSSQTFQMRSACALLVARCPLGTYALWPNTDLHV